MKRLCIETTQGKFHYREFGQPQNPVVVLLHGWPQTGRCWEEVANILASSYHVIAPDLRGLGDSNRALEEALYTKAALAKDMVAILDALEISRFYLAGHDWGGAVAQEMAFLVPDRIRKLVILDIMIIHNPEGQKKAYKKLGEQLFAPFWYQFFLRIRDFPEALLQGKEEEWIRFFVKGVVNPIEEEALQEYIRCFQIPGSITTYANLYRTMGKDFRRWQEKPYKGKKLEMETLIILGTLDRVITKEYFEGVDNCFSEVKVELLESGHFIMDEKPEEVADLMVAFWAG
ncbi:alpha/beta hydrolase [bacterium]|nr:alpha/beta hydrolase [bacterium]